MIDTIYGTLRVGDKVIISGELRAEWRRTVIRIDKNRVKVAGPIYFDLDTLRRSDHWAHKIIGIERDGKLVERPAAAE